MMHRTEDDKLDVAREFVQVFSTPQGQRVLEHILSHLCGVDSPLTSDEKPEDPYRTFYAIGRRDVGVEIKRLMNYGYYSVDKPKVKVRKPNE